MLLFNSRIYGLTKVSTPTSELGKVTARAPTDPCAHACPPGRLALGKLPRQRGGLRRWALQVQVQAIDTSGVVPHPTIRTSKRLAASADPASVAGADATALALRNLRAQRSWKPKQQEAATLSMNVRSYHGRCGWGNAHGDGRSVADCGPSRSPQRRGDSGCSGGE